MTILDCSLKRELEISHSKRESAQDFHTGPKVNGKKHRIPFGRWY